MLTADIIGLDLGRTAIKAVRYRRTWHGRETLSYFREEASHSPESPLGRRLKDFAARHRLDGSHVVTSLSCQEVCIRTAELPFDDPKKLAKILPFEIEPLVPLPIDESILDYRVLPPMERGRPPHVLVAVAPRATVEAHLGVLREGGLTPASIDLDGLALLSLCHYAGGTAAPTDVAIIDIGACKTTLCLTHAGRPVLLRTLSWGGDDVTDTLAKRAGCSWTEANAKKAEVSARQLEAGLAPFVQHVRVSLHAYEALTQRRLRHVILCGGGSALADLPAYLAGELDLAQVRLSLTARTVPPAGSVALGLAVRPAARRWSLPSPASSGRMHVVRMDWKRVIEAGPASRGHSRKTVIWGTIAAIVLALLLLADVAVYTTLKEGRVRAVKTAVQAQFRQSFPGLEASGDEVERAGRELSAIRKKLDVLGATRRPAIPALTAIVHHLPPGLIRSVMLLTIESETIVLEAETDSFESTERIAHSLRTVPGVHEVTVSDARVGAVPNHVLFRVTIHFDRL